MWSYNGTARSTLVERYLEQQQAVACQAQCTLHRDAKDIVRLFIPLKKATTMLCDDSRLTASLIVPLKHMTEQCNDDSTTIAQMKRAILKDLTDRYEGAQNKFLLESTGLDPQFRSLRQLNDRGRKFSTG